MIWSVAILSAVICTATSYLYIFSLTHSMMYITTDIEVGHEGFLYLPGSLPSKKITHEQAEVTGKTILSFASVYYSSISKNQKHEFHT